MATGSKAKSNAERFIDAFCEIEGLLKKQQGVRPHTKMKDVIEVAAASNATVKKYQLELDRYRQLRNAISHERIRGKALAEPHDDVVTDIESILRLLSNPPLVGEKFCHEVMTFSDQASLVDFATNIASHSYSQAPVYSEGKFRGLLAAATLTRWLGSTSTVSVQSLEQVTIGDVLKYAEAADNFEFVSEREQVAAVVDVFETALKNKRQLDAVLITDDGTDMGALIGIVTAYDLPDAYQCIGK